MRHTATTEPTPRTVPTNDLARTGIPGLDHILRGGLPRRRLYLVQGDPGVGKTTLALQFLLEGVRLGERVLYITLSETLDEMNAVTASHGWSLDRVDVFEMSAGEQAMSARSTNTLFHPSEAQLSEVTRRLTALLAEIRPARVVFDSLSEVRLMAGDPLRYRREILALKAELAALGATVLLLDDRTAGGDDQQLQSLAHGVISLARETAAYGPARRRVEVRKLRGVNFLDGYHDLRLVTGGLVVYPRLAAGGASRRAARTISSGNPGLDELVGGGLDASSSVLLMGPAGIGKSTVVLSFVVAAAKRGEKSALFVFDEAVPTIIARARGLGMDLEPLLESGLVTIRKVEPAEMAPGEFARIVVDSVEHDGASIVVIDGLNGYINAMPSEEHLTLHLHELISTLNSLGATFFMIVAQHGVIGPSMSQPVDVTYLADTVLLFRYYEHAGEVRQAISVFKRRRGGHERTIRELRIGPPTGIQVGEPLHEFRGVLTGVPVYFGNGKRE